MNRKTKTTLRTLGCLAVAVGVIYTVKSMKSYLKAKRDIAGMFAVGVSILICTSCSSKVGTASYKTSEEAVNAYASFLSDVKKKDNVSMETLQSLAKQWRQTNDSVMACMGRDTTKAIHADWSGVYKQIHDSIRGEFQRMALTRSRNLVDVVNLKLALSTYQDDEDLTVAKKDAMPFFASLDSVPLYKGDSAKHRWSASMYEKFLDNTLASGFHSQKDLLRFIKEEDFHFRNFLNNLSDIEHISMSDVTRKTEQCCMLVFKAANRKELSYKDAMVYLTMRTNRRLLLNAKTCIEDIRHGKVKTEPQAQAYFWMLLQPYTSIDGIGMALLTEQDRADLIKISADAPQCIGKLAKLTNMDESQLKALPHLFMKVIIATY